MGATDIEWTEASWNPGVYGCAEVSPACAHCYAAPMAHRLAANGVEGYASAEVEPDLTRKRDGGRGVGWTGIVRTASVEQVSRNAQELPKKKRAHVFVTSMADLFHEDVPSDFLVRVFAEMALRPHLTFQVLTKRPKSMRSFFDEWHIGDAVAEEAEHVARKYLDLPGFHWDSRGGDRALLAQRRAWPGWPLPNVWLGCTVEDQARASERVLDLVLTPARVRFLSCEPLLGPLDLRNIALPNTGGRRLIDAFTCDLKTDDGQVIAGPPSHAGPIDWVIAGGESGHRARPTHPAWFRSLRDACAAARVPFFFKQWGEWAEYDFARSSPNPWPYGKGRFADWIRRIDGSHVWSEGKIPGGSTVCARVGKAAAGRSLDGVEHNGRPDHG